MGAGKKPRSFEGQDKAWLAKCCWNIEVLLGFFLTPYFVLLLADAAVLLHWVSFRDSGQLTTRPLAMDLLADSRPERQLGNCACPWEKAESCARKGIFYQKARLLQPNEDAYSIAQLNDRTSVIVNVGGNKYQIPWTTLDQIPLTRLGRLKACSNYEEIMDICDDYDVNHNEFFFDRNPCAFRTIMTFLTAGKLRLLREMCALSFQEELVYWGIEDENLEWCCRRKLYQKVEDLEEIKRFEVLLTEEPQGAFDEMTRLGHCMKQLRDMVEKPDSGIPGKIFACLSVLFVTITTVSLCVSTMPDLREEEERVSICLFNI